ncbi:MAG: hypothetical protein ABI835_15430 [Chloroflexota bacterium]
MQTPTVSTPSSRESALLARSAFALLLIGALVTLGVGIVLLGAPVRSSVRTPMLLGYGAFFLLVIAALGFILAAPLPRIHAVTNAITRLFGRPALALVLALLIVIGVAFAVPLINGIVASLSALSLLLIVWSAIAVTLLALCNTRTLNSLFTRTRNAWTGAGIILTAIVILSLIFFIVGTLLNNSLLLDRLRGSSDYRELLFFGNETNPDRSRAYWVELGSVKNTWLSYTYTRMQPFAGQYIHIDSAGRRATASFADAPTASPDVYFFGGSTMWGEGSRDDYTLPSQVARLLDVAGTPIHAQNYGQIAYVSTQDEILFERQLALGNVPDTAVFYGGFNDLAAVYISNGTAGLPHNEVNRQRDLIAGQILRDGRPLFNEPAVNFDDLDFSLVAMPAATPAQIVDLYLGNLRLIRAAAREFGVTTLFIWQPALIYKRSLTPQEQIFVDENRLTWPGFDELYRAVDEELRRRVASDGIDDILILSDLFTDETRYLFYDRVHVIEDANTLIAQAITPSLVPLLAANAENP